MKTKLPLDPNKRNPLLQKTRLLNKLAKNYVAGGGTCDTEDLLHMLMEDGISANYEDATLVANACANVNDRLRDQSKGWEKLKIYTSSLDE